MSKIDEKALEAARQAWIKEWELWDDADPGMPMRVTIACIGAYLNATRTPINKAALHQAQAARMKYRANTPTTIQSIDGEDTVFIAAYLEAMAGVALAEWHKVDMGNGFQAILPGKSPVQPVGRTLKQELAKLLGLLLRYERQAILKDPHSCLTPGQYEEIQQKVIALFAEPLKRESAQPVQYHPSECQTCGSGFFLPSGVCDHCNTRAPEREIVDFEKVKAALLPVIKTMWSSPEAEAWSIYKALIESNVIEEGEPKPIADKAPEAASSAGVGDVIREYIRAMANNEHIPGGVVTRAKELYAALSGDQSMTELTEAELSDHDPIGDAFGKGYVKGYKARAIVADQVSTAARSGDQGREMKCTCHNARRTPQRNCPVHDIVDTSKPQNQWNAATVRHEAARQEADRRREKTSWTCPDCCVNPCRCGIYPMGDKHQVTPPEHQVATHDWLPHNGRECPVPGDTVVSVKFANGFESVHCGARGWFWEEDGSYKIIAYRIVKPGGGQS